MRGRRLFGSFRARATRRDDQGQLAHDPGVVVANEALPLPAFYALMSEMDLVIGMRLHSTLTALRAGVPAIHVGYTLKGADIFGALGLRGYVIELSSFMADPLAAAAMAERALADEGLHDRIEEACAAAIAANQSALARCVEAMTSERR